MRTNQITAIPAPASSAETAACLDAVLASIEAGSALADLHHLQAAGCYASKSRRVQIQLARAYADHCLAVEAHRWAKVGV